MPLPCLNTVINNSSISSKMYSSNFQFSHLSMSRILKSWFLWIMIQIWSTCCNRLMWLLSYFYYKCSPSISFFCFLAIYFWKKLDCLSWSTFHDLDFVDCIPVKFYLYFIFRYRCFVEVIRFDPAAPTLFSLVKRSAPSASWLELKFGGTWKKGLPEGSQQRAVVWTGSFLCFYEQGCLFIKQNNFLPNSEDYFSSF